MDTATHLALRSIVRALVHGGHVGKDFPTELVAALNDAIDHADELGERGAVHQLETLRGGIAKDFAKD